MAGVVSWDLRQRRGAYLVASMIGTSSQRYPFHEPAVVHVRSQLSFSPRRAAFLNGPSVPPSAAQAVLSKQDPRRVHRPHSSYMLQHSTSLHTFLS